MSLGKKPLQMQTKNQKKKFNFLDRKMARFNVTETRYLNKLNDGGHFRGSGGRERLLK